MATAATLLIALLGGVSPASIGQIVDDPVREVDALTLQWIGLEQQKDLLQANWRAQKPVLGQQLSLLERETRALEEFLDASTRQQDEVERTRLELLEQQTRLEQEQDALDRSLVRATSILRSLRARLPTPLVEAWTEDLPRLDDPLLTASEKLQLVLELLGQLDDFEQKITLHETVTTLADGRDYLVKQVYLGLSHGWYVSADRRFAAAGMAGPDGWQWTPVTDGTPIDTIVGILERRLEPALVSIPLTLNAQPAEERN